MRDVLAVIGAIWVLSLVVLTLISAWLWYTGRAAALLYGDEMQEQIAEPGADRLN